MESKSVKLVKSENGGEEFYIFTGKELGSGGYGVVYEARPVNNQGQRMVVKVMEIKDQSKRGAIEKEFKILGELPPHENLVRVFPSKMFSCHNYYLLMEYCEGGDLLKFTESRKNNPFSEEEIYEMFYQCMNGYKTLYDKKILHQDIKPDNILIRKGVYKLADFGLSLFYENHDFGRTREGTLRYIAPEKLQGPKYQGNHKSDIYSFGVMFFEIVTGKHPYLRPNGKRPSISDFILELMEAKLKLPGNLPNKYSLRFNEFFDRVILGMVKKSESARISFNDIWEYMAHSDIFEKVRNQQRELSKQYLIQEYDFVVAEVTSVLSLPLTVRSELNEEDLRKQREKTEVQNKQMVEDGNRVSEYFVKRRLVVYYIDRLARKLVVEQLKHCNKEVIYDRLILYLMLFNKSMLNILVTEIKTPTKLTPEALRGFKMTNPLASEIIGLLRRDHGYVEDSLCDLLSESHCLSNKEVKEIFNIYKHNNQQALVSNMLQCIRVLLENKAELIDVSNKTHLVTLVNLITISEVLEDLQQWIERAEQLADRDNQVMMSDTAGLVTIIEGMCGKKGLLCGFDTSGLYALEDQEMVIIE